MVGFRIALALLMACVASGAKADAVADFFAGKQIAIEIGSEAGGGYDIYGRAVARHLGRLVPGNPAVVARNMPGAGSLKVANFIYNQAPKDGTEIGAPQNGVAFEKIFHTLSPNGENALFDATKFTWLGSASESVYVLISWHDSPVKTFDDLYTKELIVGAPATSTDNYVQAVMLNRMFGTKLKIVTGYAGSNAVALALERGEIGGSAGNDWSTITSAKPQWLSEKRINILLQLGLNSRPALKDVPSAVDLAKTPGDRQVLELIFAKYGMSRPFMAPPGLPPERAKALRDAFAATLKDPQFLADAEKQRMEINPVTGEQVDRLVRKIFAAPPELAARAREAIRE
ncbi:MAG TPA: tripartite tricarboxylate transporter substrate-binding protein [Alphaproteobacteria bacterium]|nr:tripartite tricarboxylate transporter substrate-binding protein [Alphaproteobacteria bacterium]